MSSVEGIEAFINLDTLHCCSNQIKELDVSANTELRVLVCWNSDINDQLTSLNISKNKKLEIISVPYNQLKELDVSNNPSLYFLNCIFNQITNLDVSKNTNLGQLWCDYNQLSSLDISNNFDLRMGLPRDAPLVFPLCIPSRPAGPMPQVTPSLLRIARQLPFDYP